MQSVYPDLSELAQVIGPIKGAEPHQTKRPLCENIFDVQRSELFDVLDSLRTCFWSDEAVEDIELQTSLPFSTEEVNTSTPLQTSVPQDTAKVTVDLKRVRIPDIQSEENDYTLDSGSKKRFRPAENISGATEKTTHSILYSKHSTLKEFASLWQTKIMLIRSLRAPIYKEKDLVQLLLKIHKTHSRIQCHHLSLYLIPVAKAMRKHSIVEILNKWICN